MLIPGLIDHVSCRDPVTEFSRNVTWHNVTHGGLYLPKGFPETLNVMTLANDLQSFRNWIFHYAKYIYKFEPVDLTITNWLGKPLDQYAGLHRQGRAVDIVIEGIPLESVWELAQIFGWRGGVGLYSDWVHLDTFKVHSWKNEGTDLSY